jgi:hypothetical protein
MYAHLKILAVSAALVWGNSGKAGQVRISFLNDDTSLQETLAAVRQLGGTSEGLSCFKHAVQHYNSTGTNLHFRQFHESENGFYHVNSMPALIAALPFRLCDTPHEPQLNCFDAAFLLATDQLQTKLTIDQAAGPFLVNCIQTNGHVSVRAATTPREAFVCSFGQWYLEQTAQFFTLPLLTNRACAEASIVGLTQISATNSETPIDRAVFHALQARWRSSGVRFPDHLEVVLVHLVSFPGRMILTDHSGILFRNGKTYTYVEKSGTQGPFVRLDFDDRSDLLRWLAAYVRGAEQAGYTHFFATFNAVEIKPLLAETNQHKK